LRQRRRAATIHNMISTPRTPTPPPLPVNAGGRPSTGTRGGEATSAAVAVRLRTHARRPKRRGGESRTSAAIVDRRTSSLASRYGLRIFLYQAYELFSFVSRWTTNLLSADFFPPKPKKRANN
jgi:hypothetical protein